MGGGARNSLVVRVCSLFNFSKNNEKLNKVNRLKVNSETVRIGAPTAHEKVCSLFAVHCFTQRKRCAFTLAEVLITLGIIGVVAALTMPVLIQNYQKMVLTNQLKKTYSQLGQALETIKANEGVTSFEQTPLASIAPSSENETKAIFTVLSNYLNTADIKQFDNYKYTYLNSNNGEVDLSGKYGMFLTDGTIIIKAYNYIQGPDNTLEEHYYIDLNGLKGPNVLGRDIFHLGIFWGKFTPISTKMLSSIMREKFQSGSLNDRYWENGSLNYNCRTDIESRGEGCAARILEKGKMDY